MPSQRSRLLLVLTLIVPCSSCREGDREGVSRVEQALARERAVAFFHNDQVGQAIEELEPLLG